MKFQAKFSNFFMLKKLTETIKELTDYVHLECNKECIRINAVGSFLNSNMRVEIGLAFFENYQVECLHDFVIDARVFYELLKMAQHGDVLELVSYEGHLLDLVFYSPGCIKRTFKLNLFSKSGQELIENTDKFKCSFIIGGDDFGRICNNMQIFSNVLQLSLDSRDIEFKISNDLTLACVSIPIQEQHCMDLKESCCAHYSCRLLSIFNKSSFEKVIIKVLDNNSLLMEARNDATFVQYYVAPHVDYFENDN